MNKLPEKIQLELEAVNAITDNLGKGIDDGVKLLVAALLAHGFVTTNSCFGHEEYGFPFVDISSKVADELIQSKEYISLLEQIDLQPDNSKLIQNYNALTKDVRFANIREGRRLLSLAEEYQKEKNTSGLIVSRTGGLTEHKLQTQMGMFIEVMEQKQRLETLRVLQKLFDGFTDYLIEKLEQ